MTCTLVSINKACIKLYDHIEQFISSLAMSKVAADNKLPNKSVNRLPYGLITPSPYGLIPPSKTFAYTGVTAFSIIL